MCECVCWLIFTSVIGIIFYVLDVATDIVNGVIYLHRGHTYWGIATLIFVFLPVAVYVVLLFVYNLLLCCKREPSSPKRFSTTERLFKVPYWRAALEGLRPKSKSCCKRMVRYLLVFCRMEPVLSYIECIQYALRGSGETFYEIQKKKNFEIFIDTCLESLPQIALQIYILGRTNSISGLQVLSLVSSILSAWFIFVYIHAERRRSVKTKVWLIKMIWWLFGGIPTLLGSFPAISFFASVYDPPYLLLYIALIASFSVKWLFITTLKKYNKLSIRTVICIVITLIKIALMLMITLWFVSVKNLQQEGFMVANLKLKVEDPTTFIPNIIWPDTHPLLQKWAKTGSDFAQLPAWAVCNRKDMFRNGTFVTHTDRWLAAGGLTDNTWSFLKEHKLFCIFDISTYVFCTVFYCIALWIAWDIFFYCIRCCVPSDAEEAEAATAPEENELLKVM